MEDTHLNAYSVVLSAKKSISAKNMNTFLYVCQETRWIKFMRMFVNTCRRVMRICQLKRLADYHDIITGHDYGVYVMKFMEDVVTDGWDGCTAWSAAMPKFRAEITADIFKAFYKFITAQVGS